MTPARVYLETTMFSFYYGQETSPEYRQYKADTRAVFELIKAGKFEPFTSLYAVGEIDDEKNQEKRLNMRGLITDYGVKILEPTDEARRLADLYVREGVVSPAWITDAAHIAITAVNGLDFIVSLNFEHIARPWTIERVRRVNIREDSKGVGIYKPGEVLEL
jgi:hypothetical protein